MRSLLLFVGFLILYVEAQTETGYSYNVDSPADKIKDNPGKCYEENVGLFDKDAVIKVPGKCQTVTCLDGGKYKVKACSPVIVEPPCYAIYPDTSFPQCCKFVVECIRRPGVPEPPKRL